MNDARNRAHSARIAVFCAFLLILLMGAGAAPTAANGLTTVEVLQMQQVAGAAISHDGKLIAYTLIVPRTADQQNGPAWQPLYVRDTKGGPARPFLSGEVSVADVAFSPDDRYLAFRAKRDDDEKTQVWVMPIDGGEARRATASETSVQRYRWSPDGTRIAYIAVEPADKREKKLKEKGYLPEPYEENLKPRTLYMTPFEFGAEPAESEPLTEGLSVWQMEFMPDGRRMVITTTAEPLIDQRYMFQKIQMLNLQDRTLSLIADNTPGKLGTIKVSPDGLRLAYTGALHKNDHAASQLYVLDLEQPVGQQIRNLTPPAFEGHAYGVAWRDSKTLLYLAAEGCRATISRIKLGQEPQDRKVLFDGAEHGLIVDLPRCQPGADMMALIGHSPTHPRELFIWNGKGRAYRLTDTNPWLAERSLGEQRIIRYPARDGLMIEGILVLPVGYVEGRTFPLLVDVHGGPESYRSNGWNTRYASLGQVAAARGYGVFWPNYRGSTGRGLEFAMSAFGDPAGKEYDDIADGIDWLVKQGLADPERVGLSGGSYGGYAACWFGTYYTDKVKAVVSFVGVSDLVAKRLLTDIPYEDEYVHMGSPVREMWDLMRERSPIAHADRSRTAVLLLHGDSDPRVHPSQSQEMYRALRMGGHPAVRLVFYPGEGHGNRKRAGQYDVMHRMLDWFDWYVRDQKPLDGPLPPLDISERYGLDLSEEGQ